MEDLLDTSAVAELSVAAVTSFEDLTPLFMALATASSATFEALSTASSIEGYSKLVLPLYGILVGSSPLLDLFPSLIGRPLALSSL